MPASEAAVLSLVKLRLGLTDEWDALVSSYVQEVGQRIQHYCNLVEVPDALERTWASMTIDALRIEQPKLPGIVETSGAREEITVGDTSVSMSDGDGLTNTSKSVIDAVVLNYRTDLNRYRRMRW